MACEPQNPIALLSQMSGKSYPDQASPSGDENGSFFVLIMLHRLEFVLSINDIKLGIKSEPTLQKLSRGDFHDRLA